MDLATVRSYLNDPKTRWEKLRHLRPVLLDAARNKNMKVVSEFLNHKVWGKEYCDDKLIETVAQSQWKDGWDLVVQKSVDNDKVLACLIAIRPNPERFNEVLDNYWKVYTDVKPRSKKMDRFLSGVHQIALAAIRFNDPDLYQQCKTKSAPYGNRYNWIPSMDLSKDISKYMCCWALDDLMRSSGHPHHFLAQFLSAHSFVADTKKLLALCHTLLEISPPSSEDPHKLINTLFEHTLVHNPIFNTLCKQIDAKRQAQDPTIYSSDVFEVAYRSYFDKHMTFDDAAYWCGQVWNQRIAVPATGANLLLDMLTGLLNASADAHDWSLVTDLAQRFPDTYDVLIDQFLQYVADTSTVDQLIGAVNDTTDQAILKSQHNSPSLEAFRQKTKLTTAIELPSTGQRSKKI